MPKYLLQAKYSHQGIKGLAAENSDLPLIYRETSVDGSVGW
jgi:hypothetical protein